jgi:hypothetical protein
MLFWGRGDENIGGAAIEKSYEKDEGPRLAQPIHPHGHTFLTNLREFQRRECL